jgi:MFS transporter, AAHS family, 4-hydroxybenzoate transporter
MKVDVSRLIDESPGTSLQKLFVAGTALTIILDGIDNQLLGNAIPSLMEEWSLERSAFSTALAMSPLGMMIGGAIGGILGDRIGRRTTLLASVISFAVLTAAVSFAESVTALGVLRFFAGLGLGGAMPNAAALACEYVPRRQRQIAVTVTIVCIPVGAMLAAFMSARIIPAYGWRALFLTGGVVPIVIGLVLWQILPESPRYLASKRRRWPELIALLRKFGHTLPADTEFVEHDVEQPVATNAVTDPEIARQTNTPPAAAPPSIGDLFAPDYLRDTLALIVAFFFGLTVSYLPLMLLVAALKGVGFSQPVASDILGWWNIGGIVGALFAAMLVQRLGSRITMLGLSLIAIVCAFVLASMNVNPEQRLMLLVMCIILGASINAVQVAMYALAAHVYPTRIRGTGIGTAVAAGRVGNVLAPYIGNFALDSGGVPAFFATFAIGMIAVFIALAVVQRHVEA